VRDKLTEISGMRDVIAKDLWDAQQSAHAQVIDLQTGKEAATQVGALLLTASLSTAVNAVKGLTREEWSSAWCRRCASRPSFWPRSRTWRRPPGISTTPPRAATTSTGRRT
jgi:hypothetical protein